MKIAEKVSRWVVFWLLLSLLLKCSATTMDLATAVKVASEYTHEERNDEREDCSVS